jgi:hypothetical protein
MFTENVFIYEQKSYRQVIGGAIFMQIQKPPDELVKTW